MSKRDSQHGDMGVDWDADARRAAAAPYPYTESSFFNYFKDLVKPGDRVLEVGCQIASWIWAWRGTEPTVRYEGLDWSLPALTIARERYGINGKHAKMIVGNLWAEYDSDNLIIGSPAAFYHGDASEMDFEDEYDIVFTHTFYQHTNLETKRAVAPRVAKALKPGGLHIIQENTSYNSDGTWFRQGWIVFFEQYGFQLVRDHDIPGGGTGFVFRV